MRKIILLFLLLPTAAFAQQADTMQERLYAVCQVQRNTILGWHADAESQRSILQDRIKQLQDEIERLKLEQTKK